MPIPPFIAELPGGIIEPGEQPADAAVRECFKETGVIAVPEI